MTRYRFLILMAGAIAALAIIVGIGRTIFLDEQQPARALIVFGGIALATCLAAWLDNRSRQR